MRRSIFVASCLALLCLAALAFWAYMKHGGPGAAHAPDGNGGAGSASQTSPGSVEKAAASPILELPVRVAYFGDDRFAPCYVDFTNMTIHVWKDVLIRRDQVPHGGPSGRIKVLTAKEFMVAPFDAPVKYLEGGGGYKPGYLDRLGAVFYAWKGVVLNRQELLDNISGQNPVAKPAFPSQVIDVIEIDMPSRLKDHPELWKKT